MKSPVNFLAILIVLILNSVTFSDTIVSGGQVDGIWGIESSPYIIQGGTSVADSNTLTIEPGVIVLFETGGLRIDGTLVANGDVNNPIIFTSAVDEPNVADWSGISVYSSACNLTHCIVEFASTGIYCYESSPYIANCIIQHNSTGISVKAFASGCSGGYANPTISSCIISENQNNGVSFRGSGSSFSGCIPSKTGTAAGKLSDCDIFNNDYGVYVSAYDGYYANGSARPKIVKNRIFANIHNGIRIAGDDPTATVIEDNDIFENFGSGIICTSTSSGPSIFYNMISGNGINGIYNSNTRTSIEYNYIIENNANGVVTENLESFQNNGIFNNSEFQCKYLSSIDQAAPNNDWGNSESNEIDALIYDHLDDPNLGIIQYLPFQCLDDSKPTVVSVSPADGERDVSLNVVIEVIFSEDMRASTLNTNTVILSEGENIVSGKVTYSEGIIEFVPDEVLKGDTVYTMTLTSDIQEATYLKNSIDSHVTTFVTINTN